MYSLKNLKLLFALMMISTGYANAADKIIMTGWDSPTSSQWRAQLPDVEKQAFFTGYIIKPTRVVNNKEVFSWQAFTGDAWHWDEFKPTVADLTAVQPKIVKDNFLLISANPGNIDFFDDAAWMQVVDHFRLLSRLAKVGGLKGLAFDTESYTPPFKQFSYLSQKNQSTHSFKEYQAKAQQRGAEVLRAMQNEYPDIELFSFRLMSQFLNNTPSQSIVMSSNAYGLMPDFVSGMLNVAGPNVQFIDANEDAYLFNTREDFENTYMPLKTNIAALLDDKSRKVWKTQVKVGHGVYLDAYFNKKGSKYFVDSGSVTVGQRIAMNIVGALNASDGWVLVYGEKGFWWKGSPSANISWLNKNGDLDYLRRLFVSKNVGGGHDLMRFADVRNDPEILKDWNVSVGYVSAPDSRCFSQLKNIAGDELLSVRMLADSQNSPKFFSKIQWLQSNGQLYPYSDPVLPAGSVGSSVQYSALVRAPKNAKAIKLSLCSTDDSITRNLVIHDLSVTRLLPN